MDWSAQTNEMMKTWGDAQKRLWSGWMDWAKVAGGGAPTAPMFDPMQFFQVGADAWSGLKEGPTQRLAGNIFGTPEVMTRSMNLLMKAWQTVAPKLEAGKPWQPDLQKLLDDWRQEVAEMPKRSASAAGDFAQLSKSLFERWTPMTAPWMSMITQATSAHPGEAFLSGTAGLGQLAGFQEIFRGPFAQMSVGELPRATVAREKMGKMLKMFDALKDLQDAQKEYQKTLSEGLAASVEKTIEHLVKLADKGEKVTSPRDLMRTWYSIADQTLMQKFNTAEFLKIQDKLTDALMGHKKAQREAMEIIYNSLEIPTRSEIDEAYKDIHAMKREIRSLRRALKDPSAKPAPGRGKKKEIEASEAAS